MRREKLYIDFVTFTLCYSFIEPVCITKFLERITLSKIKEETQKKSTKSVFNRSIHVWKHFIENCLPEYKSKKCFFFSFTRSSFGCRVIILQHKPYHSQFHLWFLVDIWKVFSNKYTMHTSLFRGVLNYQIIENRMEYTIYNILMKTVRMIMAFCRCSWKKLWKPTLQSKNLNHWKLFFLCFLLRLI